MKRKQLYEVGVPVEEVWVFRVEAYSRKEAWELCNSPSNEDAEQICTVSGTRPFIRCLGTAEPTKPRKP